MPISVTCDCGKRLTAPDALAGSKARCVACGAVLQIPGTPGAQTPAPAGDLWDMVEAEQHEEHNPAPPPIAPGGLPAEGGTFGAAPPKPAKRRRRKRRPKGPERISYAGALLHPLRGHGIWVILLVGFLSFAGFCIPFFEVVIAGYMGLFFMEILHFTAVGIEEKPRFPNLSVEALGVGLLWWLAGIAAAIPLILAGIALGATGAYKNVVVVIAAIVPCILVAFVYQPMAALAISVLESWSSLNPATVCRGIGRVPGPYLLVTLLTGAVVIGVGFLRTWLTHEIFILGAIVSSWLWMYSTAVLMRITGALYYNNRRRFKDWH